MIGTVEVVDVLLTLRLLAVVELLSKLLDELVVLFVHSLALDGRVDWASDVADLLVGVVIHEFDIVFLLLVNLLAFQDVFEEIDVVFICFG